MSSAGDCWAEWLARRRFGGDSETRRRVLADLGAVRERLLDRARFADGESLLDVGCGEGLIGFGALARGAKKVTFSDISTDLLAFCREAAADLGVLGRCAFAEASADDLSPIADAEVDVVTTRSVLIYVKDKASAFSEFARVLRPRGRISLFEPINRFAVQEANTWGGYDLGAVAETALKVRALYERIQPRDSDPMLDFDERDLVKLAESAGFFPVNLTLEAVIEPVLPRDWQGFLDTAGNPNIPTLGEAMEQALTPPERTRLTAHLRPLVEQGRGRRRMATAYLAARKPEAA